MDIAGAIGRLRPRNLHPASQILRDLKLRAASDAADHGGGGARALAGFRRWDADGEHRVLGEQHCRTEHEYEDDGRGATKHFPPPAPVDGRLRAEPCSHESGARLTVLTGE